MRSGRGSRVARRGTATGRLRTAGRSPARTGARRTRGEPRLAVDEVRDAAPAGPASARSPVPATACRRRRRSRCASRPSATSASTSPSTDLPSSFVTSARLLPSASASRSSSSSRPRYDAAVSSPPKVAREPKWPNPGPSPWRSPGPSSSEHERHVCGVDPLLQLLALLLGEPAGLDRLVDPVLERVLQRVAQRARLDAELLRGVVDHRLAPALRRQRVGRCNCAPGTCHRERRCSPGDDRLVPLLHRVLLGLRQGATSAPSRMRTVRWTRFAIPSSWVTTTTVRRPSPDSVDQRGRRQSWPVLERSHDADVPSDRAISPDVWRDGTSPT